MPGRKSWTSVCAPLVLAVLLSACGTDPPTPTSPSQTTPDIFAALSCAPPASRTVHQVPAPGSSVPVQVWVEDLTPPAGARVRAGDAYRVNHRTSVPPGVTVLLQVHVGVRAVSPVAFRAGGGPGCVSGAATGQVVAGSEPQQLFLQVWVAAGSVPPPDFPRVFDRPPDYVASEPVNWVVVP